MKHVVRLVKTVLRFVPIVLLAACNSAPQPLALTPTSMATQLPAVTDTLSPTEIPSATPTPLPSPTPTLVPSPTPTPNPMTIEAMRQRQYPGSPVVIEQTLAPGANYDQYVVSYLSEGLKIYALMTVPIGEKPATGWPVIVFNHGYIPPNVYRTTERYVAYVAALARSGYIVLKPDYRGNGSSEGEARGAYGSPDYVVDDLNALASIEQYPDADRNRIGMWGHSMGGYITLRAMVISKDIKAGVIWAGVVGSYADMFTKWHVRPTPSASVTTTPPPDRGWRNSLIATYGTPEQNPAFWDSISANAYLADLSGPLQLHHTLLDHEVPEVFSESLVAQATAAGKQAELFTYPGDDHNIANSFNVAMQRTIAFFDEYVKGTPAE
jgi:dipeptidyl aminopeptidase/acylaminoacyl peptidase